MPVTLTIRCQKFVIIDFFAPTYIQFSYIEFSGAWCKRGEGGQGREGVQLPDSLVDEAVLQSVGPGLETPQSPP